METKIEIGRKEENIMLKDFTIANLLDLNETIAKDLFEAGRKFRLLKRGFY